MADLAAKKSVGSGMRVLLALACVVVVVAGLKAAAEFFIPVILGLFFAVLSLPVLNWLYARRVPRPLAIVLTIGVDLLVLGGLVFIFSGAVGEFQDKRMDYAENLRNLTYEFSEKMDKQLERLDGFWTLDFEGGEEKAADSPEGETEVPVPVEPVPEEDGKTVPEANIPTFKELFNRYWDTSRIVDAIGGIDLVNRFTSMAAKAFFALVIMIFLLAESGRYATKVRGVMRVGGPNLRRFQNSSNDLQKYLAIKTGASAVTGILASLACAVFGVDFPVLWGLVAFLFNFVPVIGSIVAAIPPVTLALMESGFLIALAVFGCYLVINVVIGNFLEPMLLGRRFGISTVVVILSVMIWGYIWGPVGMFLAVPLTMVIKVMLDNSSDLRWISVMMGKGGELRPRKRGREESVEREEVAPQEKERAEGGSDLPGKDLAGKVAES